MPCQTIDEEPHCGVYPLAAGSKTNTILDFVIVKLEPKTIWRCRAHRHPEAAVTHCHPMDRRGYGRGHTPFRSGRCSLSRRLEGADLVRGDAEALGQDAGDVFQEQRRQRRILTAEFIEARLRETEALQGSVGDDGGRATSSLKKADLADGRTAMWLPIL